MQFLLGEPRERNTEVSVSEMVIFVNKALIIFSFAVIRLGLSFMPNAVNFL